MISGSQVYQVARSVARGDGEWAEVPRCVREAIVLSLSSPQAAASPPTRLRTSYTEALPAALPPVLSEGVVQRSVQTFEDGAWVRDQAVRSYAQFHNSVEALHTGMRGQLRSLWRTAMQLSPPILDGVRREYGLERTDDIPDGVPIHPADAARMAQEQVVLEELVEDLQRLRDTSVRFAAHWLTDRELMAMGADPAYLRPAKGGRAASSNPTTPPRASPHHSAHHRHSRSRSPHRSPTVVSSDRRRASSTVEPRGSGGGGRTRSRSATRNDPQLRALRRQYVQRLAELTAAAAESGERRRGSARRSRRHGLRRSHSSSSHEGFGGSGSASF